MDVLTIATILAMLAALTVLLALRRLGPADGDEVAAAVTTLLGAPLAPEPSRSAEPEEAVRWRLELLTPRVTTRSASPEAQVPELSGRRVTNGRPAGA